MIEKQILLEQLNDRIQEALGLITLMYPGILKGDLRKEDALDCIQLIESMKFMLGVVIDIQYNNNAGNYIDDMYGIARREDE